MFTERTYKRTNKYYEWHRTDDGKGKKGDKGKGRESEGKEEDLPPRIGKYCYAKVTADVSRKDGYTIFYPACGTLLAKGKWEIFYREELVTFDETLDENKHIMCVLVNSDGHTPTEVEVLRSFRKVLQEANEAILNLNKQKWEALEKVFDAAEKHGLREFQYLICEAFESLYKVDMSVDDNIL
ncbi:hypothetical protein BDV37DRAFT_280408 [Aspergillus pseudonomiae]|uniref:Uncharacterized protein n=1 Tax=Aspergillus pseudonomiae TaxID=1506151 RepID=A0A5N7DMS8_9EURO|nr:uncharacterized protein BDV37DRAFT_280408 [Aspergillus pseudonomiae]KAE8406798.1 hypothetical protein BDV37DRAFT_280408 [Aspergillus pseudonomiae]